MEAAIKDDSIKARLLEAGKTLFADRGFAGVSVREICKEANASSTMIHHYFGSKKGLFDAIVEEFSHASFEVPLRLISKPPKTKEEFLLRLEMFISETFRALVSQATVFQIIVRDSKSYSPTALYHKGLNTYLAQAQEAGFVERALKTELVTGMVLDRLGGQIMYASRVPGDVITVLNDEAYAEEWLAANTTVLIHGFSGRG